MPVPSQGVVRSGDGWAEPHWKVSSCQGNSLISRFDFTDHAAIVNELLNPVGAAVARGDDSDLHLGRTTSAGAEAQRPVTGERRQPPELRLGIRRFHQQAELWEPRLTSCLFPQQPPLEVHHRRWTAFMRLRALVRGHKGKELVQFAQAPALPQATAASTTFLRSVVDPLMSSTPRLLPHSKNMRSFAPRATDRGRRNGTGGGLTAETDVPQPSGTTRCPQSPDRDKGQGSPQQCGVSGRRKETVS